MSSEELHAYICTGSFTFILTEAALLLAVLTVMVAEPGFFAVTRPFPSTEATFELLLE